jgi:hypothetical protein
MQRSKVTCKNDTGKNGVKKRNKFALIKRITSQLRMLLYNCLKKNLYVILCNFMLKNTTCVLYLAHETGCPRYEDRLPLIEG